METLQSALVKIPNRARKTVADLGCGSGRLLPFLASRFDTVVAVDYAPATLASARDACVDSNVVFRRRDLRDLTPFRNTFHVAVALDSVVGPRTADVDRMLRQICRSLVEGGVLLATFPAAPRVGRPVPMKLRTDEAADGPLEFQEVEIQYRLRQAGFQGVRIRRFEGEEGRPASLLCLAVRRAMN
jgi:SAM-dependent methyltransferase